jgi:hypothetical protein
MALWATISSLTVCGWSLAAHANDAWDRIVNVQQSAFVDLCACVP